MREARRLLIIAVILLSLSSVTNAQADLLPELRDKIDRVAADALAK